MSVNIRNGVRKVFHGGGGGGSSVGAWDLTN